MEKVRFGIVGMGVIGLIHGKSLLDGSVPDGILTAISSRSDSCLPRCREAFGCDLPFFTDYHEMFRSGLIDAVIIATPHKFHPEQVIAAFKNGLHVMVEKPAGIDPQSVEEMNRAAAQSGKVFGIMFNIRTEPVYQKLRELVQGGQLGRLKRIGWTITDWYRCDPYYASSSWRASWKGEGGGVLINQCSHTLDLWQWMFGVPDRIQAFCSFGKYHPIETEDDVTAYMEYNSGVTGTLITSTGELPGTNRLEIAADNGKLVFEDGKIHLYQAECPEPEYRKLDRKPYDQKVPCTVREIPVEGTASWRAGILENFSSAILRGEPLIARGEDGLGSLRMSCAMVQSAWTGKMVHIPDDLSAYAELLRQHQK
ncbi:MULTISPECIES: Gfo/Idh/MocA family protein [Anaerotruncus]|uniref:Gfo/Idh/MocA family protein n=1 Tax=Anaerotruncus TaxID=244127 RepID=UPI0008367936|nr:MULTISPECIES: Gfo/Idh/MocA family oxidoreductase [Anaerotruncus]RGX55559.1 gfo/Idh/MocA family oxidoreductase [Anaerotruncus sp. AF02-27]